MEVRRKMGNRAPPAPCEPRGPHSPYAIAHACFTCRKSFKVANSDSPTCPQCSDKLHMMGRSFKAPKKTDDEQWEKVEELWKAGFRFWSYRSFPDAEPLPKRLKDVADFIERNSDHPMRVVEDSD